MRSPWASEFIDQGSAHLHEAFPGAVEGLDILLGEPFHRDKAHRRPCHRFPDGFSVPSIVLMGLDIRFDKLGRHQLHRMPMLAEPSCPIMRTATGLHTNYYWGQL